MKKKTTVELLNESEKASLYSISFEMDGTTEFEKILNENIEKGYVSIEEKELSGIEDITFEI
ncbi:MAG: hypothetical protein J5907_06870 [Bacteroidales bacterium]|nr:hypothetical protein [Bacteroidales bacterium]